MEQIKKRVMELGYDDREAESIIDFYERKGKMVSLIEYLNCMETCKCESTDIEECLSTCY